MVKDKKSIDENIDLQKFKVIDARSKERFEGKMPEPRKGLRSGNIKNSLCIPFSECLNKDKTFKNQNELNDIFKSHLNNLEEKNIVFSCGSGVTACVLALAYSLINDKYLPCIYDGSWAEYGIIKFNYEKIYKNYFNNIGVFFNHCYGCDWKNNDWKSL